MKHRMVWTYSKGTVKTNCRCGWQSQREPHNEEGGNAIREQIKKHKKEATQT